MVSRRRYRLKRHYKFEQDGHKYVADLETGDLIKINDVEWEVLSRYESQTRYQIVRRLKGEYKLTAIFEAIERLERFGEQGTLLSPSTEPVVPRHAKRQETERLPKVLVPFHFTNEKSALSYITGLNRYLFLRHLSAFAELETLAFSEIGGEKKEVPDLDEVRVRNIDVPKKQRLGRTVVRVRRI